MYDIESLRATHQELGDEAKSILSAAEKGGEDGKPRLLTDEENARLEAITEEREKIARQIRNLVRLEQTEKAFHEEPVNAVTNGFQVKNENVGAEKSNAEVLPNVEVKNAAASHNTYGYRSLGEFALDVRKAATTGVVSHRLSGALEASAATSAAQESVGVDGGFLVPEQFMASVQTLVEEEEFLLPRFRPITINSNTLLIPVDETAPWGSSGVQARWVGEGAVATQDKPALQQRRVELRKLISLVPVTDELLEDAQAADSYITSRAASAIRSKINGALVDGSGVGEPLGVLKAPAKVTVAKENSQTAATIVLANVTKAMARGLGGSGFWIAHKSTLPQIIGLTNGNQPVFLTVGSGARDGVPTNMLFGSPLVFSEHAEQLGTEGDIIWVNPVGLIVAVKATGVNRAISTHLFFDADETAFRFTFRMGTLPLLSSPVSRKKGSDTLSHFVTVATRS